MAMGGLLDVAGNLEMFPASSVPASRVAKDPRVHLVGYGPSASTIGANRAGRAAARELMELLEGEKG